MDTLKQKALDYTLGVLPKDESLLFEAMVEENDDARQFLAEAQEDFAKIALSSKPKITLQTRPSRSERKDHAKLPTKL